MSDFFRRFRLILALPLWFAGGLFLGLVLAGSVWWMMWDGLDSLQDAIDQEGD